MIDIRIKVRPDAPSAHDGEKGWWRADVCVDGVTESTGFAQERGCNSDQARGSAVTLAWHYFRRKVPVDYSEVADEVL